MTTTFEKFAGTRRWNYCTLPTKDVEILPDHNICDVCNTLVMYVPPSNYGLGHWVHVVDSPVDNPHVVTPRVRCRYCNSHDAKFRQHAWYDAVECNRCGGVDGYAIGD